MIEKFKQISEMSKNLDEELNCEYPLFSVTHHQLIQISIINREGLSDTWEIEE